MHILTKPLPSAAHRHTHRREAVTAWFGRVERTTVPELALRFLIPAAVLAVMEKLRLCVHVCAYETHVYFYSYLCFVKIEQPGVETAAPQIVFSRWCLHNEYTMSLSSTPCLNAWKQQSPNPSPHPTCLSLLLSLLWLPVTGILCFKALNLFIFFARHTAFNLWWRNWSRRQNVPILWLHKAELF